MKSFEYSGMWWLPTQQEHKVPGIARFADDDRINLALNGLFEPERGSGLPDLPFKKHPLILGLTDEGLAITLSGCFDTNLTSSLDGNGEQRCRAFTMYIPELNRNPQISWLPPPYRSSAWVESISFRFLSIAREIVSSAMMHFAK